MMVLGFIIEIHSAFAAETQAILPANRLEWQCGSNCAPHHRVDVNQITNDPVLIHFIIGFEFFAAFIVEELLNVSLEIVLDGLQATSTFPRNLCGSGTRYQDSLMYGFKAKI